MRVIVFLIAVIAVFEGYNLYAANYWIAFVDVEQNRSYLVGYNLMK